MLPKKVFTALRNDLKKMREAWDADRKEKPHLAPYEIDSSLPNVVRKYMSEIRAAGDSRKDTVIVNEFRDYMIQQGILMKSPYGGTMFKIDVATIPTKDELIQKTLELLKR